MSLTYLPMSPVIQLKETYESTEENMDCCDKNELKLYQQNLKLTKLLQTEVASNFEMKTFDVGSIESSDTFLSCYTHPFNSLADLTEDTNEDNSRAELLHNVYINPMEVMDRSASKESTSHSDQPLVRVPNNQNKIEDYFTNETKKLNVISSEQLCNDSFTSTSSASPLIKKSKFFQGLKTRFDESNVIPKDFHETAKQVKQKMSIKSSFFPYRGRTGSGSKASLLISDLNTDSHKQQKKSILKKNDSMNAQSREEMEKLLPESPKHVLNRTSTTPKTLSLTTTMSLSIPSRPTGFLTPQTSSPSALCLLGSESTNKTVRPLLKQIGSSKVGKQITPPPVSVSSPTPPPPPPPPTLPLIPIFQTTSTTRLIGAVAPIQLSSKSSLKKADTPLVRCSNPVCYYNKVCRATPLCAGCGHRIETLKEYNDSKPRSVPLTPTTPDSKHDQNISRQPSNESAPPAYS